MCTEYDHMWNLINNAVKAERERIEKENEEAEEKWNKLTGPVDWDALFIK
jgi:hypothetical protein